MKYFLCLRSNPHCKRGQWFLAEEVGEPLFAARVVRGPKGFMLSQTSRVGLPFDLLAEYIIEPGFQIPRSLLRRKGLPDQQPAVQEVIDFQDSNADIIEPEVEKRIQRADPSYREKSGIVVPRKKD